MPGTKEAPVIGKTAPTTGDHLEIKDSRTGKTYTVPITDETIRTSDLKQIKVNADDFGMMGYDPAFMNTASCRSAITFIDGDKGILRYRGYPIEQLAEKADFLEVAWLLRHGELPTQAQYDQWVQDDHVPHVRAREHQAVHGRVPVRRAPDVDAVRPRVAALSSFYPTSKNILDETSATSHSCASSRRCPTLAAFAYRHVKGMPYVYPDNSLPYARELPLDGRAHVGAAVRGASGVRAGDRHPVHPARRSRAELLDERGARGGIVARRSVLGGGGGHRGALRPAARRRQRGRAAHARGDRRA